MSRPATALRYPPLGLLLGLLLAAALAGCSDEGARRELRGSTMGTTWSVIYAEPGTGEAPEALQADIELELVAINATFSTYIPDSEISRINAAVTDDALPVSDSFAQVLDAALAIYRASGGAYDVTVGPLIELWGFGSGPGSDGVPSQAAITAALERVGSQQLDFDPQARRLARPAGVAIDLSSIAKGYAVDRLAELLQSAGVGDFLVEIGGELRAAGERPGGGAWRLAIEAPRPVSSRVIEAVAVGNAAVATSGDYRNYFEVDGTRYSHLVDPRTGYPVEHDLVSVTVVHPHCMTADAWATALLVMGRESALSVARAQGLAVYLVARDGEELAVEYTPQFADYLVAERSQRVTGQP